MFVALMKPHGNFENEDAPRFGGMEKSE